MSLVAYTDTPAEKLKLLSTWDKGLILGLQGFMIMIKFTM